MARNGAIYDINTGRKLGTVPNPEIAFAVYIDETRKRLGTENHLRFGRCQMRAFRRFITRMQDEGVECAMDKRLGPDTCILVDGTAADWEREGLSP